MGKVLRLDSRDIFETQGYIQSKKVVKNLIMRQMGVPLPPISCIHSESGKYLIINGHTRAALDDLFSIQSRVYVPEDCEDLINYADFPDVSSRFIDEENWYISGRWYDALSHDGFSRGIRELRKSKLLLKTKLPVLVLSRIFYPVVAPKYLGDLKSPR